MFRRLKGDLAAYTTGFKKVLAQVQSGQITTTKDANAAMGDVKDEIRRRRRTAKDTATEAIEQMAGRTTVVAGADRSDDPVQTIVLLGAVVISVVVAVVHHAQHHRPGRRGRAGGRAAGRRAT